MARFKVPKNFGGFTHGGQSYKADKKGFVVIPDDVPLGVVEAHGMVADGTPVEEIGAEGNGEGGTGEGA
ncbi:hypothetical protein [Paraburkholderia sp.]|uniref:hypothetical protein n=1 Tax=Paraburkholderia sp. TaxID=1926495 RepID=UPI003C7CE18D